MKIIISEEIFKEKVVFDNQHLDYHSGENIYKLLAKINNIVVGWLDYGVYEDEPSIKMMKVLPEWRRKGIGTKLIKHLQELYPDVEIELGYASDDGAHLIKSLNRKFYPDPKYNRLVKILSKVDGEIARIKKQIENEDYSERYKLNDLYDKKYELSDQISEMKSGKWVIENSK